MTNKNPVLSAALNSTVNENSIVGVVASIVHFNQVILNVAPRDLGLLNEAELKITCECLEEEVSELQDAHIESDFIGAVDALGDLIYFAVGAMYKLGLTAESIEASMLAIHQANMEKKLGVNARRGDGVVADAVKPEDWKGPEERISDILDLQVSKMSQ